jgi:hypothetical protein
MYRANDRTQSPSVSIESLEGRQLLSGEAWAPAARLINQDDAAANYPAITGAGQTIVVIDSGVDYNHPSLGGRAINAGNTKVVAGWDFGSNDADPMSDSNAHGTGTAGVAAASPYVYKNTYNRGIAPDANVIALKETTASGVEAAMKWTLANRTKYNIVAVNYTFWSGDATVYIDELKSLIANGVFVSRPAGNSGAGSPVGKPVDPADVAVGSVNNSGGVSSFSQRGPNLALLAPGENVTLPYYNVSTKQHMYVDTASGTSWSSPAVVGTAALIKQINPAFTPLQILNIMKDSGVPTYDSATKLTYKRLDVNAALALAYARKGGATTTPPTTPQSPGGIVTDVPTAQSPFSGTPVSLTSGATVQAENFDNGGEGVAYHDAETSNLGGSTYRIGAGVDVSDFTGGRAVTYTKAGEWLEYTVTAPAPATYTLSARVASMGAGGTFHVEIDGSDKTGALRATDTKSWDTYADVTKTGIALTAGQHVLRVKMDSVGGHGYTGNFDSFRFTTGTTVSSPAPTPTPTTPSRTALTTIAATTYSAQSGLTIQNGALASTGAGDWAAYNALDFGTGATKATFNLGVDATNAGRQVQIRTGGATGTIVGTLTVQNTGGWGVYTAQTATLTTKLTGVQNLYLTFAGGTGVANIQSFKFTA